MSRANLRRLLNPRHVAFVGGRALEEAIANCESLGFRGQIWVVNPSHDRIAGRACHAAVADLPEAPDAAFVGVGRDRAVEVVRELAAAGAGGCVVLASGFGEVGDDGAARQAELIEAAGDMAVLGPNCYGILNYADGVALWPDLHGGAPAAVDVGAAFVAQSGNLALNATTADRSVPLTHVLSIGNQAVTGFPDCVEVLLDDPRVRAIGLYVEGVTDPVGMAVAARRAHDRGVALVVLPAGGTPVAARIVVGHTGSDPGAHRGAEDLLGLPGVVRARSLSGLLETLKLLVAWGGGGGPRVGAVAASGGDLAVFAELAHDTCLTLPAFAPSTTVALHEQLGPRVTLANPLDVGTAVWGRHEPLVDCFSSVMTDDLDVAVLIIDYPSAGGGDVSAWDVTVDAFVAARQRTGRRAAVVSSLAEGLPEPVRRRLFAGGVVPLQGLADAVAALDAAARVGGGAAAARPPDGEPRRHDHAGT